MLEKAFFRGSAHYHNQTGYADVYRETYWGNFRLKDQRDKDEKYQIFENRNWFAREFGLEKFLGNLGQGINPLFDHCEFYKNDHGTFMYIVSPYGNPNSLRNLAKIFGMEEIKHLYNKKTTTFGKFFTSKKSFNSWLKQCEATHEKLELDQKEFINSSVKALIREDLGV